MLLLLYAYTPLCLCNSGIVVLTKCLYCFTLLLLYACTPVHLYAFTPPHLYDCTPLRLYACTPTPLPLYTCTPQHLYTSTPLHLRLFTSTCTCTPLRLYTSTLVRHSFMVHFSVHFFCCTFYYGSRHRGVEA